jgi:DNA-directed RNA polymerase subunit RPC12/RpoP
MSRQRELNERGKFSIKSFEMDVTGEKPIFWRCDGCGAKLVHGILRGWQESIDEGSVIPCPYCRRVWALNAAFFLRPATPGEVFDAELFGGDLIAEWANRPAEIVHGTEEEIPF